MFGGRCWSALGNGGQTLVFRHVDGVCGSDNVEGVVCLFGQSRRFSPLKREKAVKGKGRQERSTRL